MGLAYLGSTVWVVFDRSPRPSPEPRARLRLLDRVREALRLRHYSPRTEEAYALWIRRFIVFHGKRHPSCRTWP